ncbi:MAG: hypothetical protein ACHQQQ_02535 [Bacteroidota bacterium]
MRTFKNKIQEKTATICLFFSAVSFIVLMAIPVYFFGGAHKSCFTPILITVSSMSVITTKSRQIKFIFFGVCLALFIILSMPGYYQEISINPNIVWKNYTGADLYSFMETASVVACLIVSIALTWNAGLIFKEDNPPQTNDSGQPIQQSS